LSEFEEKILNLLEKIDEKLDILLDTKKPGGVGTRAVASAEEGYVKPSAIEKPPVEGRRVCPACGGTTFNTEEDKTQVLFQQGGMKIYAKRYICKSCGTEV